eukprot:2824103-Pleurochrysis_carterae.AAC.1
MAALSSAVNGGAVERCEWRRCRAQLRFHADAAKDSDAKSDTLHRSPVEHTGQRVSHVDKAHACTLCMDSVHLSVWRRVNMLSTCRQASFWSCLVPTLL